MVQGLTGAGERSSRGPGGCSLKVGGVAKGGQEKRELQGLGWTVGKMNGVHEGQKGRQGLRQKRRAIDFEEMGLER